MRKCSTMKNIVKTVDSFNFHNENKELSVNPSSRKISAKKRYEISLKNISKSTQANLGRMTNDVEQILARM